MSDARDAAGLQLKFPAPEGTRFALDAFDDQIGKRIGINHDDGGESWTALVVSVQVEPDGSAAWFTLDAVSDGTFEVTVEADTSGLEAAWDKIRHDRPRFCPSCGGPVEVNWLDVSNGPFMEQIPGSWSCPNPECDLNLNDPRS